MATVTDLRNFQDEANRKMEAIREEIKTTASRLFRECVQDLFIRHPEVKSFAWTQYTPYFNDGDECVFGAHTDDPEINDEESWDIEYDDEKAAMRPALADIRELLSALDSESYLLFFGDHARIVVTRGGVEVESYSHE